MTIKMPMSFMSTNRTPMKKMPLLLATSWPHPQNYFDIYGFCPIFHPNTCSIDQLKIYI